MNYKPEDKEYIEKLLKEYIPIKINRYLFYTNNKNCKRLIKINNILKNKNNIIIKDINIDFEETFFIEDTLTSLLYIPYNNIILEHFGDLFFYVRESIIKFLLNKLLKTHFHDSKLLLESDYKNILYEIKNIS